MCISRPDYVSVIGVSLLHAVVNLVERLEAMPLAVPNEVQTGMVENGHASAVIALTAVVLESAINRARYVRGDGLASRENVTTYWRRISAAAARDDADGSGMIELERLTLEFAGLADDLDECFALRDVIVHNHLWEAQVGWHNGQLQFAAVPQIRPGFGDCRFRRVLDQQTRRSRKLSLNLFPTRIWRRDAWVVLKIAGRVFTVLEGLDRRYLYLSPQTFQFHGTEAHFHQVVASLPDLVAL
jgi:hypothetical protein